MRRRAGIGAIKHKNLVAEKFGEKGNELAEAQLEQLSNQLEQFRANLEIFAAEHKQEIRKDPEFRKRFQDMCANIGVDPLASGKGFWSNMLDIGDFYYELGVQIVEVCMANQHKTGGLMELGEIRQKLIKSRGKSQHHQDISLDDLLRATKKLKVLGTGFTVIQFKSGRCLVQSVPGEMSLDQVSVLEQAEKSSGLITEEILIKNLRWDSERCHLILDQMLGSGQIWIDTQGNHGFSEYWVPSIFTSTLVK